VIRQNELSPAPGSKHHRKRVGHGLGSGHGRYSGRGSKGQKSRSGANIPSYFEGGQLPLVKRLPRKRGFTNIYKTEYSIVNVGELNIFEPNSVVTPEELLKRRLISTIKKPVKILGNGNIDHPLVVKADKFSTAAQKKVLAVGGVIEVGNAAKTG
jgi:large subunit ribosomal protein L15